MKRQSNQFSVRLNPELKEAVERCCDLTGMDAAHFMREAFRAFVEEVEASGEIRLPLAITPKKTQSRPGKSK
jgi:predicted DNA-binding protein